MNPLQLARLLLLHWFLGKRSARWVWGALYFVGILAAFSFAIADCLPFIDEALLTYIAASLLVELHMRGEIAPVLAQLQKRIRGVHVIDVRDEDKDDPSKK